MATVIIRPNSDISISANATRSSGTNDYYTYIDEATLDTGDYIGAPKNQTLIAKFGWTSSGLVSVDSINSLTFCADYIQNSTNVTNGYVSGNDNVSQFTFYSGEHPNFKVVLTANPDTGNAWSLSEVESLIGGMQALSSEKYGLTLYQIYIVVDYEEAAGGDDYTLTCAAGSYALTGTNAAVNVNYIMAMAAGSYSLFGSDIQAYVVFQFAEYWDGSVILNTAIAASVLMNLAVNASVKRGSDFAGSVIRNVKVSEGVVMNREINQPNYAELEQI